MKEEGFRLAFITHPRQLEQSLSDADLAVALFIGHSGWHSWQRKIDPVSTM